MSAYTVRDSAGVRIVSYAGPLPKTPPIMFAQKPIYQYGNATGEHTFQTILTGALRPDGSAVVADWGSQQVIVLSPSGAFRSVLVHRGRGPGEAERIRSLHLVGQDTITGVGFREWQVHALRGWEGGAKRQHPPAT